MLCEKKYFFCIIQSKFFMVLSNKRLFINIFFMSQYSYCALVWMCHGRIKNKMINRLHVRCLGNIHNDKCSTSEELREKKKDNSVTMHLQNMRFLANEIFKVIKGISPPIVNELFNPNVENIHNLRNISDFSLPIVKIVFSGLKALIYLGPKI